MSGSSIVFNHEIKKFPDFFAVTVGFLNDSQCLIAFQVSTKIKTVCFQDFTDCFPGKTLPLQPDNVDAFNFETVAETGGIRRDITVDQRTSAGKHIRADMEKLSDPVLPAEIDMVIQGAVTAETRIV